MLSISCFSFAVVMNDVRSIACPLLLQSSAFQIPLDGCSKYSVDFESRIFEFKICRYFISIFSLSISKSKFRILTRADFPNMQEQHLPATTWKSWLGNILAPSTYTSIQGLSIFLYREIILRSATGRMHPFVRSSVCGWRGAWARRVVTADLLTTMGLEPNCDKQLLLRNGQRCSGCELRPPCAPCLLSRPHIGQARASH